jgi:2-succinyl-5-enolpyruvyl-6-hydroxy-3-cyclohexene-1-carboxylate synthase
MVFADVGAFARALAERRALEGPPSMVWAERVVRADAAAWECVAREAEGPALTEGVIARRLCDALPADAVLCVGNSTPVRDLDTYVPASARPLRVLHQRGASGIDGLVAGAAGARSRVDAPVALLLGDVSLSHDLGALALAGAARGPLVLVAVQNRGGRIFEQLPIARRSELGALFDAHFLTPQSVDLSHAAAAHGLAFRRVTTPADLTEALAFALARDGATLLEAVAEPDPGGARRAALQRDISARARGAS